jgi:hypothetical protein
MSSGTSVAAEMILARLNEFSGTYADLLSVVERGGEFTDANKVKQSWLRDIVDETSLDDVQMLEHANKIWHLSIRSLRLVDLNGQMGASGWLAEHADDVACPALNRELTSLLRRMLVNEQAAAVELETVLPAMAASDAHERAAFHAVVAAYQQLVSHNLNLTYGEALADVAEHPEAGFDPDVWKFQTESIKYPFNDADGNWWDEHVDEGITMADNIELAGYLQRQLDEY